MSLGNIISLVFVAVSVLILLFLIFGKASVCRTKFRNHVIATAGIYVSGTVLVALLFFFVIDLPLTFVLLSDGFITIIFVFMAYMIIRLGNNLESIREELTKNNEKNS